MKLKLNKMSSSFHILKKIQLIDIGLMAIGGAVCGLLILKLIGLNTWWTVFSILGLVMPFIAVLSGNMKRLFLLLIAFIIPINPDIHLFHYNLRISMSSLIIIVLYIIWIIELSTDKKQKIKFFPRVTIPAAAFLFVTALSLITNINGSFLPILRLFEPFCDFLLFFYVANIIRTEADVKYVVWVLLVGVLLQYAAAMVELWGGIELDLLFTREALPIWQQEVGGTRYARISGLTEHANMLAIYLSAITVLLISLMFCETRRKWKFLYWTGIGTGFFIIINTFSRSSWFVFCIFIPLTYFIYSWKLRNLKKVVFPAIVLVIIITVGIVVLSTRIMDRMTLDYSALSRLDMIKVGLNIVKDNPYFGVGLNNFINVMYYYDRTSIGITSFNLTLHNIYLLVMAETGIIGFLVFLWFNYAICFEGWRFVKSDIGFLTNVGLSFFLFILMFFLYGMVNPFPRFTYIYFPLGMFMAIKKMENEIKIMCPDNRQLM